YLCLRPLTRRLLPTERLKTAHDRPRTCALAVCSLMLSGLGFLVPVVGTIPGLVCGHAARWRFRADPGLRGQGLAIAGLAISYAAFLPSFLFCALVVWAAFEASKQAVGGGRHAGAAPTRPRQRPPLNALAFDGQGGVVHYA